MAATRLPGVGRLVALRAPDGADDVHLLEAGGPDLSAALGLLARVACEADGGVLDVASLPLGDVDALLLRLRQRVLGDAVSAEARCTACGERVDVSFSVEDFLGHHLPEGGPAVTAEEAGWFRLPDAGVEFRLPRAGDLVDVAGVPRPAADLLACCARPADAAEARREEIEAAMEAMSPSLYSELEGRCPACGGAVAIGFDPLSFVVRELRDRAALVYEDVCIIARHLHWSEAEILALPAARRSRYAELAATWSARGAETGA